MVARSAASTKITTSTSTSTSTPTGAGFDASNKRFKGVRMRSWGKWVSEIRLPNTRARLWLGSYSTADQAARAFDVAMVCLRGRSAALNFPDSPPSYAPLGLPHHQIQELAASAAASSSPSFATSSSLVPTVDSRVNSDTREPTAAASSSPSFATSSSPVPTVDSRFNSDSEPISAASHESEADTTDDMRQSSWLSSTSAVSATVAQCSSRSSTSGGSDESEAATTNEMNSSSCSSPLSTAHTLEDLLLLDDEDDEQSASSLTSSPLAALQEEQTLHNMGGRWEWEEELLWGCASVSSSYSLWDLLAFPPLPADDDLTAMVEPCLWSL